MDSKTYDARLFKNDLFDKLAIPNASSGLLQQKENGDVISDTLRITGLRALQEAG